MAAQENRVDGTVGAGFKPAHATAAPQNSPNSPICVVLQLVQISHHLSFSSAPFPPLPTLGKPTVGAKSPIQQKVTRQKNFVAPSHSAWHNGQLFPYEV